MLAIVSFASVRQLPLPAGILLLTTLVLTNFDDYLLYFQSLASFRFFQTELFRKIKAKGGKKEERDKIPFFLAKPSYIRYLSVRNKLFYTPMATVIVEVLGVLNVNIADHSYQILPSPRSRFHKMHYREGNSINSFCFLNESPLFRFFSCPKFILRRELKAFSFRRRRRPSIKKSGCAECRTNRYRNLALEPRNRSIWPFRNFIT